MWSKWDHQLKKIASSPSSWSSVDEPLACQTWAEEEGEKEDIDYYKNVKQISSSSFASAHIFATAITTPSRASPQKGSQENQQRCWCYAPRIEQIIGSIFCCTLMVATITTAQYLFRLIFSAATIRGSRRERANIKQAIFEQCVHNFQSKAKCALALTELAVNGSQSV